MYKSVSVLFKSSHRVVSSLSYHLSGYNLPNYNEAKRSADRIRDDEHHVRLISEHEGDLSESAHHRIASKQRKGQKVGSTLLYILSYLRNRARIKKERSACLQCCNQVFISNHIGSDIESYNAGTVQGEHDSLLADAEEKEEKYNIHCDRCKTFSVKPQLCAIVYVVQKQNRDAKCLHGESGQTYTLASPRGGNGYHLRHFRANRHKKHKQIYCVESELC
mmetsp:Transcript_32740/g.84561  ORF Transcript_32740/g.84561 Transcript_32740/m.84561 type:complete len:220 (+) Transcript_32740:368-1027(+)